jgi:hypothetical protein
MTKKEKLERLLYEIPCLYEDYNKGEVKRYTPFGKYNLMPGELEKAYSIVRKSKLLCVIEQDSVLSGETLSLINYVIDTTGFTPKKQERINPAVFFSNDNMVDIEDYKQTAYVFRAYCYNVTWDQYDHGEIGIVPYENTIIRVW